MLIENFKMKYTSIPFATHSRDHKKYTRKNNIDSLFHMHKEIEMMLVLEGKAELYTDKKHFEIKKGNIIFIAPYVPHRYTIFSDYDFKHYCICFDLELLSDKSLMENLENGTFDITPVIEENKVCEEFIKNLFKANAEKSKAWELRVIGNLTLLFATLLELGHIFQASEEKNKSIYSQIIDYIAHNFSSNITSSHISNALHINNSYFCRLFRKNFGYCFQNYLCMYRIEKSKPLLKHTNLSISEIAYRVGFNSFSYYSKKFKEYVSMTPKEYRNK